MSASYLGRPGSPEAPASAPATSRQERAAELLAQLPLQAMRVPLAILGLALVNWLLVWSPLSTDFDLNGARGTLATFSPDTLSLALLGNAAILAALHRTAPGAESSARWMLRTARDVVMIQLVASAVPAVALLLIDTGSAGDTHPSSAYTGFGLLLVIAVVAMLSLTLRALAEGEQHARIVVLAAETLVLLLGLLAAGAGLYHLVSLAMVTGLLVVGMVVLVTLQERGRIGAADIRRLAARSALGERLRRR